MSDTIAPEEGKFYKARSGRKLGPARQTSKTYNYWSLGDDMTCAHEGDGHLRSSRAPHELDLVAEWQEGPVVTERVKRIVEWEGEHGVRIKSGTECMFIDLGAEYINLTTNSVQRMRGIATIMTQLADALEGK